MKLIFSIALLLGLSFQTMAQDKTEADTTKKKKYISVGSNGIQFGTKEAKKDSSDKVFDVQIGMLDLGINYLQDNTNYNDPAVKEFLPNLDSKLRNENLFSLREGKSINVNIYPVLVKYRMVKTKNQRVYLAAGLGLQMYNFRFNRPITYINETKPQIVINDSLHFSKNKVGLTYLSIPLMLNFKTRLAKEAWLVYGAGITAGYRIASWTKQVSDENGKQKNQDQFNFNNFNSCVTAEIGLEGYFRLYASYQLTALHEDTFDQHPYCIGLRFLGI